LILYAKNGTFLGMGKEELSILGYEDMEEFKSCSNDFADLFVNHPGYISKFKNFSWIDYILHSGTPNKNVILKHKNGREIESELIISEISLMQDIENSSSLYCIELGIINASSNSQIRSTTKSPNIEEELTFQEAKKNENVANPDTKPYNDNDYEKYTKDSDKSSVQNYDDYRKDEMENFQIDSTEDKHIHLKISDNHKEESKENNFKLKIDTDEDYQADTKINYPSQEDNNEDEIEKQKQVSFDEIPIMSKEFQDYIQATTKTEANFNNDDKEKTTIEETFSVENNIAQKIEFENIDFTQIAEDTGMDLGDIAVFIEDFISESKNYINSLEVDNDLLNIDFAKDEAMKLKGVGSNLKMEKISFTLNSILKSSDTNEISSLIKQFQRQIEDLQEQLF